MDTTDPDIVFDENGVCSHCHRYDRVAAQRLIPPERQETALKGLVEEIRRAGVGKEYDCIIGVSGGVDSTYVAWLVKQQGLRPLAVHLDNGWNSDLAVTNIQQTLNTLGIDLHTHVIDWEEFRNLQLSFLMASTPDGEVPTDHAISALLYSVASKYRLKHVISGTNIASEAILPEKWGYGYFDWAYIRDVHRSFNNTRLSTYPHFGLAKLFYYVFLRRIRIVSILNYITYNKESAMQLLEGKLGWVYYGGKHYESIYTRFYQSYVLPKKFNIDKRRAHYANMVLSGQLTRDEALVAIEQPVAPKDVLEADLKYTLKKLGLSAEQFDAILVSPNKTFLGYKNSKWIFELAKKLVNASRRFIG